MAHIELTTGQSRLQRGFAVRQKKLSLKIDMTPMVDLGFLLISFFIFTSSMNEPKAMSLVMPEDKGPSMLAPQSGAFTIIIGRNSEIYYYEGLPGNDKVELKESSLSDIRKELIRKKQQVLRDYKTDKACEQRAVANQTSVNDCRQQKLTVLIKPTNDASYDAIVAVLDEMTINKIARYVLAEPDPTDIGLLSTAGK